MTLPAAGNPISYSQIQQEFGGPATNISLQSYYRINTAIAVTSGTDNLVANIANTATIKQYSAANLTMDMNQWWNTKKGYIYNANVTSTTTNYNLFSAAVTAGWNQSDPLDATIVVRSGAYIYSTSTGTDAFVTGGAGGTSGSFPDGSFLRLLNLGVVSGCGGNGGPGTYGSPGNAGSSGGRAMLISSNIYINNTGTIGGGGGGGYPANSGMPGNGGSGIIIIKWHWDYY